MLNKLDNPLVIEVGHESTKPIRVSVAYYSYEHSWNPSGNNFSVSEENSDNLVEDRLRNIWENFMKLINSFAIHLETITAQLQYRKIDARHVPGMLADEHKQRK
jgi:hypothetical protein